MWGNATTEIISLFRISQVMYLGLFFLHYLNPPQGYFQNTSGSSLIWKRTGLESWWLRTNWSGRGMKAALWSPILWCILVRGKPPCRRLVHVWFSKGVRLGLFPLYVSSILFQIYSIVITDVACSDRTLWCGVSNTWDLLSNLTILWGLF